MSKPFLKYDLADFSNTNKEQKSLAEIRRDAYTEGFMCGKAEGREDVIREIEEIECEGLQREDGKYIKLSSFQQKLEQIKEQNDN